MEKNYNTKVVLEKELNSEELDIFNRYWALNTEGEFIEKPSQIVKSLALTNSEVYQIAKKSGYLAISKGCSQCQQPQEYKVFSQTAASNIFNLNQVCNECLEEIFRQQEEELIWEENKAKKIRANKFADAIKGQSWRKFKKIELLFILDILTADNVHDILWSFVHTVEGKKWRELFKADKHGLLDLVKNDIGHVTEIYFMDGLKEEIENYLDLLFEVENQKHEQQEFRSNENQSVLHSAIDFLLVKNPHFNSNHDSTYYGDISFDRDILIKANTPYAYSVWPRAKGNAWISIRPSDSILKSKNIKRPNEPMHIGDVIKKLKE